jgi:hypothetical protein
LKKAKKGYYALKDNYKDVLSDAELNEAFKNDTLFNDMAKIAKKGMIVWSIVWGILLVLAIIVIECLTTSHGLMVWLSNKVF